AGVRVDDDLAVRSRLEDLTALGRGKLPRTFLRQQHLVNRHARLSEDVALASWEHNSEPGKLDFNALGRTHVVTHLSVTLLGHLRKDQRVDEQAVRLSKLAGVHHVS